MLDFIIYMESIIQTKALAFSKRIVKAEKFLRINKKETVLSKQLLRSGTSVSANIAEAEYAQSKLDFINKMSIALKEANESRNWIELLYAGEYIDKPTYDSIYDDINQIIMILIRIIRTSKQNLK